MIYPYDGRYSRGGHTPWEGDFYHVLRDGYLNAFKRNASGLRGPNPAQLTTDEWWALGRHYGLVTPLLDWTESPYIAAYFAFSELLPTLRIKGGGLMFSPRETVAIYRLFNNGNLEGDGLQVVRPIVEELGRMHGQRGLFTWLDSERYFELQGFLDDNGRGDLLTQFIIPAPAIQDGLRDLQEHGINFRLLFPDLVGAAMCANWDGEHANLLM